MSVRNVLLGLAVAAAGFIVGTVAVTELVADAIEFSLLVGLPVGIAVGLVAGVVTYLWLASPDPPARRRGASLAALGVVFLGVLVGLVAVAGVRNSQALPVAVVAGVVAGVATYLWHRRPGRDVTPLDPS